MENEEQLNNKSEEDVEELYQDDVGYDIPVDKRKIYYEVQSPTIKSLYDSYKSGDLILNPSFQRNFVWDKKKASNLIESILLDIPIPLIFTSEDKIEGKEEVIDGQQRLTSIFSYIDKKFPDGSDFKLTKLRILENFNKKSFTELEKVYQKRILGKALQMVKIKADSQEDVKFEMFERLNTNIIRLNAQEIRNCIYRGEYNNFLHEMSKDADFQFILNKPDYQKRMLDSELVLLFFSFYHKNYELFKGNMKQFINDDMRKYRKLSKEEVNYPRLKAWAS